MSSKPLPAHRTDGALPLAVLAAACLGLALASPAAGGEETAAQETPALPPAVEVTVHLRVAEPDDAAPEIGPLPGRATWYGRGEREPVRFSLRSSRSTTVHLPPGRWVLEAEAEGYWCERAQVEVSEEPRAAAVTLWPAGAVEGGFHGGGENLPEELPREVLVFFRPAPEAEESAAPPTGKAICPVEEGVWRCALPAGRLDLRVQPPGYVPRYQWGVTVPRGKALALGRLSLQRGNAVLGWVVTADGTPLGRGARVVLRPRVAGAVREERERARIERLGLSAPINERGFFQIEAVPAGQYVAEVLQEPFAPGRVTVQVEDGQVTEIADPPIVLEHPLTLRAYLDPPQDPAGEPWRVRVRNLDRGSSIVETVADSEAAADGSWEQGDLAPRLYRLEVHRGGGDVWWVGSVDLSADTGPVSIDMEVVEVRGTVRFGGEPLAAELAFGGKWGLPRIRVRSDAEGEFRTVLPNPGDWIVYVESQEPPVLREILDVAVEPAPGTDRAAVEIELPDTTLRGLVVTEEGDPVDGAIVDAESIGPQPEAMVEARSEPDGRFEIRGLAPGPAQVQARSAGDLHSDTVTVEITEEREPPEVRLIVRRLLRVEGRVLSASGPVAGARVGAWPVEIPVMSVRMLTTDAQGRFEARLPRGTRSMRLSVAAPGFAYRMLRIPLDGEGPLVIGVEQRAGTLRIETPSPPEWLNPAAPGVFVAHGGHYTGLAFLTGWAKAHGIFPEGPTSFPIPAMEPGEYEACLVMPAERPSLAFGVKPPGRCDRGYLAPGGELTLAPPAADTGAS